MQVCLSLNSKLKRLLPCEPDACIKTAPGFFIGFREAKTPVDRNLRGFV